MLSALPVVRNCGALCVCYLNHRYYGMGMTLCSLHPKPVHTYFTLWRLEWSNPFQTSNQTMESSHKTVLLSPLILCWTRASINSGYPSGLFRLLIKRYTFQLVGSRSKRSNVRAFLTVLTEYGKAKATSTILFRTLQPFLTPVPTALTSLNPTSGITE